ncbi:MAG: HAD hydrolase family protein [Candidatus Altiarchaeota archaeon]
MQKTICFDLEGPLSPQDNAYELMALIPNGKKIFEVISKYDDVLTLEKKPNYEPGDTLSLIVPFLIYHNISEDDIKKVSDGAKIVSGAKELISKLKELGFRVYIISTSYEQHAFNIGKRVGVSKQDIYCTKFPLDKFKSYVNKKDFPLIEKTEREILKLHKFLDRGTEKIKDLLDKFFWCEIQKTSFKEVMKNVIVVGGKRKLDALLEISKKNKIQLNEIIVIGDSITDYRMLDTVKKANGLAIVFNGNEFALPYGNFALASQDIRFLIFIVDAFIRGGKDKAIEVIKKFEESRGSIKTLDELKEGFPENLRDFLIKNKNLPLPYFHYLEDVNEIKMKNIIEIHKKFRKLVRGEAAKLG